MMLLLNGITILLLCSGLFCTLVPRFHGAVIIGIVASVYAVIIKVNLFQSYLGLLLLLLIFIAEFAARGLSNFLTRQFPVTGQESVDTVVCNAAALLVGDALFGPLVGTIIWKMLVGKKALPRLDSIGKVLSRLLVVTVLRLLCGIMMILIVIKYIMYTK
jgi:hypothetical protein